MWKSNSESGDDAAVLALLSYEEPASPRHRAGVASMAWRTTRRFSRTRRKILISTQVTLTDCCATTSAEGQAGATGGTFGMFSDPMTADDFVAKL